MYMICAVKSQETYPPRKGHSFLIHAWAAAAIDLLQHDLHINVSNCLQPRVHIPCSSRTCHDMSTMPCHVRCMHIWIELVMQSVSSRQIADICRLRGKQIHSQLHIAKWPRGQPEKITANQKQPAYHMTWSSWLARCQLPCQAVEISVQDYASRTILSSVNAFSLIPLKTLTQPYQVSSSQTPLLWVWAIMQNTTTNDFFDNHCGKEEYVSRAIYSDLLHLTFTLAAKGRHLHQST